MATFTFVSSSDDAKTASAVTPPKSVSVSLDPQQQEQLLDEADVAYSQGASLEATDVAESKLAFATAAEKYQLLVDSGVRNSQLYSNLGNAFLQQNKLGKAIASFENARRLDPSNGRAVNNLKLAKQRISNEADAELAASGFAPATFWTNLSEKAFTAVPSWSAWTLFGVAWLGFWSVAALKLSNWSAWANWSGGMVGASAALVLIACGWILAQDHALDAMRTPIAVVTDVAADVRSGAGDDFQPASGFELSEGAQWRVLQQRGDWCQVESDSGSTGWVKNTDVVVVPSV